LVLVLEAEVFELYFVYGVLNVKRKIVTITHEFIVILNIFEL